MIDVPYTGIKSTQEKPTQPEPTAQSLTACQSSARWKLHKQHYLQLFTLQLPSLCVCVFPTSAHIEGFWFHLWYQYHLASQAACSQGIYIIQGAQAQLMKEA